MDPSDIVERQEVAENIKQKRLSDDTTTNSSSDSEEESSPNPPPPTEKSIQEWNVKDLLEDEEKMQMYLESFPEIRGRYTRDDPNYAAEEDEEENPTPPIMLDYRPRQYGRGGGNQYNNNRGYQRGGGRGSFFQHSDRQFGHKRPGIYQGDRTEGDRPPYMRRDNDQGGGVEDPNQNSTAAKQRRLDHSQSTKPNSELFAHPPVKANLTKD